MNTIESVCVYCGSSNGRDESHFQAGLTLGRGLADAGLRLVYGAGTKGIMGAVARGTMDAGGKVTGIIPKFLIRREANEVELTELDELIVTEDMHQRKHGMFERADAFVALPGGIGTLEEIIEVLSWARLGLHRKPLIVLNVNNFWSPLKELLHHVVDSKLADKELLNDIAFVDNVPAVFDHAESKMLRAMA